jgi:hypothetical protein
MVATLSDYYKALKEYQGVEADAFEQSGQDSDEEPDGNKPRKVLSLGCITTFLTCVSHIPWVS